MIDALAGFADTLQWTEGDSTAEETPASLRPHLRRFHASSGGPWPAACSLWGQIYFNTLLIRATCLLASDWPADAHVLRLSASFSPDSGAPLRFALCGERNGEGTGEATFLQCLDRHIVRVIEELATEAGISRRMLWESVECTLRWTVAEIAAAQPNRISRLAQLAPSGCRLTFACASNNGFPPKRKFCCLRFQLVGHGRCPRICPKAAT